MLFLVDYIHTRNLFILRFMQSKAVTVSAKSEIIFICINFQLEVAGSVVFRGIVLTDECATCCQRPFIDVFSNSW